MDVLDKEVTKIPISTQKTVNRVLQASQEPLKAAFLTRSLEGLTEIAESENLGDIIVADSNYEVLLAALQTPKALSLLTQRDPLALAKIRGLKLKQQLIEAEGGCATSEEVAELLGITRQAINKRRNQGQLIGLSRGKGKYIYPRWQFTDTGKTLSGLETVLKELKQLDPWTQLAFFLNPNVRLEDKTPLEMLKMGKIEPVIVSAIAFANDEPD